MPGIEEQLAKEDMETARAREQGIGQMVPMAREPLKAKVLNSLADVVKSTAEAFAPDEMGEIVIQPVSGTVDQVPADLAAKVVAIASFARTRAGQIPELEPYQFDPAELLTTNGGLDEIQAIIGGMGSDKALLKAIRKPRAAPAQQPTEEPAEEELEPAEEEA